MTATTDESARVHLRIKCLKKAYGGQLALHDVSLDVYAGEFVALLGPSGCGKTTLLRSIAGLVTPNGGDILIDGHSILGRAVNRRDLGMVFQSYALFPHMTVAQNVAFGPRLKKIPKARISSMVDEALSLVRLDDLGARYPHQLSGGQQQRVALARAIVSKPKVLLLDEPLGALDARLREIMQVELKQLQRRLAITTVFVTHDQQEALAMADRVAVMRDGRIEQLDSPTAVYHKPATAFVADFIGQMNRVSGTITVMRPPLLQLIAVGSAIEIRAKAREKFAEGDFVVAMVRPEKIMLGRSESSESPRENRLDGHLSATMFSGDRTFLVLQTPLGDFTVAQPDALLSPGQDLALGSPVSISWRAEDTHVFAAP